MADITTESADCKSLSLVSPSPDKQMGTSHFEPLSNKSATNVTTDDATANKIYTNESLKTFMSFYCDRHSVDMTTAIRSTIDLFYYCIPSRECVLSFYSELFNEYSTYYWLLKKRSINPASELARGRVDYVGEFTRRFYEMAKAPKTIQLVATKVIPMSRRTSSCNSTDMDQTPASPSAQDHNMENGMPYESDVNSIDIFSELESLISEICTAFNRLMGKYLLKDSKNITNSTSTTTSERLNERFRGVLTKWASELIMQLNIKHLESATQVAAHLSKNDSSKLLSTEIELWLSNPLNELLVNILLECHNNIQSLLQRLICSTHNSDWLIAHILLELSRKQNRDKDFSSCMEYIIGNQSAIKSVTHILAYLSDLNPKAMANFPKSNIPFLISLCQSSMSLLNVLSQEVPDTIDPDFLNNLAKEMYSRLDGASHPPCLASLTHCIMAAPNSYKLFLLALEVKLDERVSDQVKSTAQFVIDSISIKVQERATASMTAPQSLLGLNQPIYIIDNLLGQINNDIFKLVSRCVTSKFMERKAHEILYRMSLVSGNLFASKIIGHYLNLPEEQFWPYLKPLLTKFMKHFGDDGSTLVSQTLTLESEMRTPIYWNNMFTLTLLLPEMKLNLDYISRLLIDKLCAAQLNIVAIAQLMRLCCSSLERVNHSKISISTKHRLCTALATCFFLLLEYESDNFPEILSYIRISLTCMSALKQSSVASHILCRALLERSLVNGHLFNENFNPDLIGDRSDSNSWTNDDFTSLSKENLKVTLGHRFRRLPNFVEDRLSTKKKLKSNDNSNNVDAPNKQSINSYLLIEAFKSGINNIEDFATLFVEFHCPVMFDKHSWPNDDALRVINERNLSILRKFEQIPPLWDLYELIGQNGCLKSCLVLVKALLAAHLALWASATTNTSKDKMISTSRLIPPLSQSGLVPKAFGLTVEVFPHLSPNEVFSVLSDIWQYLKDTNSNGGVSNAETSAEEEKTKAKAYLGRLRLFMCQHIPGPLYVKIFKDFYIPVSSS